jgi:type IX secretion system PorP/SprF family membrane protein
MKWPILILLMYVADLEVSSQQRPQFSQFMLNKYYENPAYGGLERSLSVFTSFRDQYSSFPGNPRTFYLGADLPFYLWNGAIGFSLYNQSAGHLNNTNIRFSYNYVMGLEFGFLSFGGRVGLDYLNFDGRKIITPDGDYEATINHKDPLLEANVFNGIGPSWEIGTYFMGSNWQGGITVSEFPSHGYSLGNAVYTKRLGGSIFAEYKYEWNDRIKFYPSLLVKADPSVLQTDIAVVATIDRNIIGGIGLRGYSGTSVDALTFLVGTNIGAKYKLYYSYDFGLSSLRTAHQGTHEIMLSYNLQKLIGMGLPPKIIYNPRDM